MVDLKTLTNTDSKGITRLNHDAIEAVLRVENITTRYPRSAYGERSTPYMIILPGEKQRRRVYAQPIGNVSIMYIKIKGNAIFCETALDQALHNV